MIVLLHEAAQLSDVILKTAFGRTESVGEGRVEIFVSGVLLGLPIHHEVRSGKIQTHANVIDFSFGMMPVRSRDNHLALFNPVIKTFKRFHAL